MRKEQFKLFASIVILSLLILSCGKSEADGASVILLITGLAIVIFVIYFVSKIIEFVVDSVNLYKAIIHREEQIIHILFEMKDNKNYTKEEIKELLYQIEKNPKEQPVKKLWYKF